jgi:dihydroorotase
MFDFWPRTPERSYDELILKKMRPGDIHTHVFAQQFPIILADGKLNPILWEARKRGVIFDVGHGAGSFWFRNAVPAVQQGFIPDSISTDLHESSMTGSALSMANVMSKFLSMGVPLEDVIRRSTLNPAREIHRQDLGTLSVGAPADVAVFQLLQGRFGYTDNGNARLDGIAKLIPMVTIRAGRILFDPTGLSMVPWQKAGPQYFISPKLGSDPPSNAEDFPKH